MTCAAAAAMADMPPRLRVEDQEAHMTQTTRPIATTLALALATALLTTACASATPQQGDAPTTPAVKLQHRGERVAVSIYEFRSSVTEIGSRGATDMFKTALVRNGRFQLVERSRLNEGVIREKQLNGAGQSTGDSAQQKLRAAEYLFEATISELSAGDRQTSGGVNIAGLQLGGGSNQDSLGIDVRIVDARNGDVRDAISLRRALKSSAAQVSGTATAVQTWQAVSGRNVSPYVPDVSLQTARKDSVDQALRGLIDDAVAQLAARF
jgi:curli biogenesis system outer membrane secretion channel CsgG